jgi:hypothetical protein
MQVSFQSWFPLFYKGFLLYLGPGRVQILHLRRFLIDQHLSSLSSHDRGCVVLFGISRASAWI